MTDLISYRMGCGLLALAFAVIGIFFPIVILGTSLRFLNAHPQAETMGRTLAPLLAGALALYVLFSQHPGAA